MLRARQGWSRLTWCLILVLALAAAVACASHPPGHDHGHDHDVGHPPLCTDTNSPVTLAQGKSSVFLDGGSLPLSPKPLIPAVFLAALSSLLLLGLQVPAETLSQSDTRTSVSPPMFLVVLRQ
jgi:hypothetical protein